MMHAKITEGNGVENVEIEVVHAPPWKNKHGVKMLGGAPVS